MKVWELIAALSKNRADNIVKVSVAGTTAAEIIEVDDCTADDMIFLVGGEAAIFNKNDEEVPLSEVQENL